MCISFFISFGEYFFEGCLLMWYWQQVNIGLYDWLTPNRREVIIWINDDLFFWHIYASAASVCLYE